MKPENNQDKKRGESAAIRYLQECGKHDQKITTIGPPNKTTLKLIRKLYAK